MELNDIFGLDGIKPSLSKRIGFWAEFDSGVGLGAIHPLETQEVPPEVWLLMVGNVFGLHPNWFPGDQGKDLRGFFESYLAGVIEGILGAVTAAEPPVRLQVRVTAADRLPEPILAQARRCTGRATNKGPVSYYRATAKNAKTTNHQSASIEETLKNPSKFSKAPIRTPAAKNPSLLAGED